MSLKEQAFRDAQGRFKAKEKEFPLQGAQINYILRISKAISFLPGDNDVKSFLEGLGYDVRQGFLDNIEIHLRESRIIIPEKKADEIKVPTGQAFPRAKVETQLPGQDQLDLELREKAKNRMTQFNRKRKD